MEKEEQKVLVGCAVLAVPPPGDDDEITEDEDDDPWHCARRGGKEEKDITAQCNLESSSGLATESVGLIQQATPAGSTVQGGVCAETQTKKTKKKKKKKRKCKGKLGKGGLSAQTKSGVESAAVLDQPMHPSRRGRGDPVRVNASRRGLPPELVEFVCEELRQAPHDLAAARIAEYLFERKVDKIAMVLSTLGIERTLSLFKETMALEQKGGLMVTTSNKSRLREQRRRTSGGVFFTLLKCHATKPELKAINGLERARPTIGQKRKREKDLDTEGSTSRMRIEDDREEEKEEKDEDDRMDEETPSVD